MRAPFIIRAASFVLLLWGTAPAFGQSFDLVSVPVDLDRWMYPNNTSPGGSPGASVFSVFGSDGIGSDTRLGQFLIGWNTSNSILSGQTATNYLLRRARVTLTINRANSYLYDGTLDNFRTYLSTNDSRYLNDADTSRPVELSGAGFRGGYTAATYPEGGPFGGSYQARNAYAAAYDTSGVLIDVSNNVGKEDTNAFEIAPFAVEINTNIAPGQLMKIGDKMTFDLNLNDPHIYHYLQQALSLGALRLMVSSLVPSGGQFSTPHFAQFYTRDNIQVDNDEIPLLDIEGAIIRPADSDDDGLPDDWEQFYFNSLSPSATDDTDGDGQNNLQEFVAGTNPNDPTSVLKIFAVQPQTNSVELRFNFAAGREYKIEWSANLQTWQSITNPVLAFSSAWLERSGTNAVYPSSVYATWRDTNATDSVRFYRIGLR